MFREIAPPNLLNDPIIRALLEATDPELQKVKEQIINVIIYPRIDEIEDKSLLDLLAWQFHVEGYDLAKTLEEKRNLVKNAIELHRYKGTKYAVQKALSILGLSSEIVEWFETGGNLPPHTFGIQTTSVPKNFKKILSVISDYKRESAHLAILTDGNCRSRLNLDRSCQLSRVLLSSLDGVKKDGVRFCFVEKRDAEFTQTYKEVGEHITRYLSARHFPVSRTKLDSFKLSRVKAETPPFSLHSLVWGEGFEHTSLQEKEFYRQTNCNLVLSSDKLSDKGFQGRIEKAKPFRLSLGKLDSKLSETIPLVCKPSLTSSRYCEMPALLAGSSVSRLFENHGGDAPLSLSRKYVLSTCDYRVQTAVRAVAIPASSEAPRFWVGSWKGYWTDTYIASGEGSRIQAESFSTLSGKASLSQDLSTPLPVVALNSLLGRMKLSSETPRFAGWRN